MPVVAAPRNSSPLMCADTSHNSSNNTSLRNAFLPLHSAHLCRPTACRALRTLALQTYIAQPSAHVQWCSARTLFGSWKSGGKAAAAEEKAATSVDVADAVSASLGSSAINAADTAAAAAAAAAKNEIRQLRQQVVDLKEALEASQETVKQLLVLTSSQKSAASSTSASATPCGPCSEAAKGARGACYVVRTSEELVDALRGRGSEHASRTILLDGKLFLIDLYGKVEVDQARVSIVGNNATVIGHIAVKGRGAVLAASDVFFLCPYDLELRQTHAADAAQQQKSVATVAVSVNATGKKAKENVANLRPVISATAGAGVHLDRCVLSNGRDGVYLGMGSHCTLNQVRIVNCIRGLYEGVGCRTSMIDSCTFQANRYHVVLLGPGGTERAARLFKKVAASASPLTSAHGATFTATFSSEATPADVLAPGVTTSSVIALQQNKADVVLQHNPITDIYEEGMVDGQRVELTGADATAGLSDPLF